ncbi:MAG: Flp pilus assembly complex ATPase component TadA [Phycisphaerae bacterium]|nr:Flp pilus assembly complex ATPase component TadA [Phycisphaerae bacterium]
MRRSAKTKPAVSNVPAPRESEAAQSAQDQQVEFAELWRPDEADTTPSGPHQWLLEHHLVTPDQIEQARQRQAAKPGLSILEALVQINATDSVTALKAVAEYFNLPFMRVAAEDIDNEVFTMLPVEYLKSKLVIPISRQNGQILVGIAEPADIFLIDDIKRRLGHSIQLTVTPADDILRAIEESSASASEQVEEIIRDIAEDTVEVVDSTDQEVTDLEKIAGESPVIRYANYLISSAVRDGASDIHIEPGEKRLRVRCRIDGMLFEQHAPPLQMHAAVISRLKIMANLDIAERRLPQDGRIRAMVQGRGVDLRVSTLPVAHGEKCVIRILDNRSITIGLENLGMERDMLEDFKRQILGPHGIVLVTGPTGSGKSTTLYSALQIMDSGRLNISTVEDPVEYELPTINQVNVHDSIGMTFSAALRSLLRQDPDIIMIGEIRDEETARIAVQASLTGHLVLSTLHTNDAPSSITRLINIGVEPYLISAAVNAVLAQRLVRSICENCKQPMEEVGPNITAYLQTSGAGGIKLYYGAGCEKCRQTGYKGRTGIYELLEMDDEIRNLITTSPALSELRRDIEKKGMHTLRQDGLAKVAAGLTTVEEIMRTTQHHSGETERAHTA